MSATRQIQGPRRGRYLIGINGKSLHNVNDHLLLLSSVFIRPYKLDQESIKNADMKKHTYLLALFLTSVYNGRDINDSVMSTKLFISCLGWI